ncbi:MAG: hypothetical protein WBG31_09025 [Marinomonas sp.]
MNNAIVRSQHHHAFLPSFGTFSALPTQRISIGRIVAVCVESDTPLFVQTPNGAIFSIGGLSDRQKQQLLTLLPDLIHTRVRFHTRLQHGGVNWDITTSDEIKRPGYHIGIQLETGNKTQST